MRRTRFQPVTRSIAALCVAAALLAGAAVACAETIIVPPRPGQVGFGMGANMGALLKQGDFGKGFGASGEPGVSVQLRYRMRYERGFGLTFDQQELDVRDGAEFRGSFYDDTRGAYRDTTWKASDPEYPRKLNLYFYGVEFYQMFDTRTKTVKMLSVGAGIAHPVRQDNDKEYEFPTGDGFFLGVGGSIERYFVGSLAVDLSARYRLVLHEGSTNHDLHAALGFIWYASL
jgi:hypothetical protein